ncbi:MAG: hypothetical protein NTV01_12590 [Bacteroidia bacterium]|nr:hypothetical protein [Bacteroidia bacterium]
MAKKILALAFLFFPVLLPAQSIKDTAQQMHMFSFHVSGHLPKGDIASRYGLNMGVGGSYWFKTRSNWLLAADYTFIFGNKFKEDSILNGLKDKTGYLITTNGERMLPTISERGFYAGLRFGKLFPVIGPNPNSGLVITAGAGLLQYKTFFRLEENSIPIIMDDYVKMLDYLTNGFAMNQFIGYLHLDNNNPINFYAGFEFHQAWTMCRRDWLYNLHGPDNMLRHDFLFGIRIGWIFPVDKKNTGTYTYF